ncbi:hypothetical protein CBF_1222 [Clostridium botulinum F str. 230613]|uniref:Uncharacterized protein n=1 Tax=Clostridium botulinum (strain Langeland / NCTC 10281 / Type F) TaxID=441772 RepID=A7GCK5_CLOBL|nr:hypothetical protein CLI_1249 [Clostridium botulinum F str. Langeland]ADF98973.1 hypothetical protein CBF_1222 [Clostridium botulinum F str. 230613]
MGFYLFSIKIFNDKQGSWLQREFLLPLKLINRILRSFTP